MLRIGICDDEKTHQEKIKDLVCKSMFKYDEIEFSLFNSGKEVVEAIKNHDFHCDLLLLDIRMPQLDGLQTASYIREEQVDVDIMFVTVSVEHVFDGYTYQAFSYLLKPINDKQFADELKRYVKLKEGASKCLHISINGKKTQIILDQVKYFRADGRRIFIVQRGEENESNSISFYAKIGELQEILGEEDFLRCHQSYIVNKKYVDAHSRTEIKMGDSIIPVSRRYVSAVKSYFEQEEI